MDELLPDQFQKHANCSRVRALFAFAALIILSLPTASANGQNPPPQKTPEPDDVIRVNSELVQTDVMVFDKQGKFVNTLQREDFQVRIDGKPRTVEFFERITAGIKNEDAQLSAARGPGASGTPAKDGAVPLDRGRTIFFYVDDLHLRPSSLLQMRKLLLKFVDENINQNDLAAVTSASGTIGFLQQLSDNKAVLRAAIERLTPRSVAINDMQRPPMREYHALMIERQDPDVTDYFVDAVIADNPNILRETAEEMVKSRARQILRLTESDAKNALVGLESLVRSTGSLPGRKLLIFISDGFFIDDRNTDTLYRLRSITSAAARSGVVIYSMDARGLVAGLEDASSAGSFDPTGRLARGAGGELLASQDAMNSLAKDTGGRTIFNTNALDVALAAAIDETSTYYLLAWRPDPETTGDKFRKISVNLVGHPDWNVRVRQGFFDREAPPVVRKKKADETMISATDSAAGETVLRNSFREVFPDSSQIPIVTSLGFLDTPQKGAMLTVSMQIGAGALDFLKEGDSLKAMVDLRGTVYNDNGKAGATFTDRVGVNAPSAERLERSRKELIYNYQVFVTPGLYQVRVGARDPASGKVGTSYEWIEVPDLAAHQLTLSSIILAERAATQVAPGAGEIAGAALRVDHRFHRNSVLRFVVYIYNAKKSESDAKPDVGVQVLVLRDQEPVITTPSKRLSTEGVEDLDRIPYGGDLSLEGIPPGHYVLQLSIVDRVSKSTATQRVRLEIM